jgi:two-component sensor histidine kinase
MVWQVVKPLRPHPLSVGQARNFCTRRLSSVLDSPDESNGVVADAAMVASELVTNAVTAGSTEIELFLALRDNCVYLEVSDDADGTVTRMDPSPTDVKGRGLRVVEGLSTDWGVRTANGGKLVWAELPLDGTDGAPAASSTEPVS